MRSPLLSVKTITTIRPYFFDSTYTGTHTHFDVHLGHRITNVDWDIFIGLSNWMKRIFAAYWLLKSLQVL